jgi:hypothetical protein
MKINLIDADSILYITCYNKNYDLDGLKNIMESFIHNTNKLSESTHYVLFLSTKSFRHTVSTDYKANRVSEKPDNFDVLKKYMMDYYNTYTMENIEADDLCASSANWCKQNNIDYCVSHIDKDLNQISGEHLNYAKHLKYYLTDEEAKLDLFKSMFANQAGDNIKICEGLGNSAIDKIVNTMPLNIKTVISIFRDGFGRFKGYGRDYKNKLKIHYQLVKLLTNIELPVDFYKPIQIL